MSKFLFKFLRPHYFLTLSPVGFIFGLMKILHSAIHPPPSPPPPPDRYCNSLLHKEFRCLNNADKCSKQILSTEKTHPYCVAWQTRRDHEFVSIIGIVSVGITLHFRLVTFEGMHWFHSKSAGVKYRSSSVLVIIPQILAELWPFLACLYKSTGRAIALPPALALAHHTHTHYDLDFKVIVLFFFYLIDKHEFRLASCLVTSLVLLSFHC